MKIAHVSGQVRDFIHNVGLEKYFEYIITNTHVHKIINELDANEKNFKFK